MYTSEDHAENYNATSYTQPGTTQMEYAPEDFSQSAINRGQRRINFALTRVDQKLAKALKTFRNALAASPAGRDIDFEAVDQVINEIYEMSERVAEIKPPGCEPKIP